MSITDPLVLPPDVLLVPVADLSEDLRRQLPGEEGDFALTRPRLRTTSRLVDARSAELLAEFRSPRTIVDVVIERSRSWGTDPETTLDEAFPFLQGLLASGFLVEEGAEEARGILPLFAAGDEVAGFRITESVHVVEDTELYQARGSAPAGMPTAALKIERFRGSGPRSAGTAAAWQREADVLERLSQLPGPVAPRLLGRGLIEGRQWLATEWWPGADALTAAAEMRDAGDRAGLLALCRSILTAYARLHEQGVLHGDVHPKNVLVSAGCDVRLIDFGLAAWAGAPKETGRPWRGGIAFFFEPEYARAARAGDPPPEASHLGEQFSVAALLYMLLTGVHYRDFPLRKEELLRQIEEEPPLPFTERGAEPWPDVEAILARALRKEPAERFASLAELGRAFDGVPVPEKPEDGRSRSLPACTALLARVLDRVGPGGLLWEELPAPPRASVNFGAAGIAHALYRIALVRDDAALLASADHWALRATAVRGDEAFYNPEIQITQETVGRVSPYHTATGPLAVRAFLAHAAGDLAERQEAVGAFAAAAREPCDGLDLTLGRSGLLLAAALLLDIFRGEAPDTAQPLPSLGNDLLEGLWNELDALPPVALGGGGLNLGVAHGWAGCLYASMRWCRSAGVPLPARLGERLAQLEDCAGIWGRGLRWPWYGSRNERSGLEPAASMPGWCNGSAGFVYLWTLAWQMLGDARWLALAEGAAWNTWEGEEGGVGNLCCGLGGRAYALLSFHRHTGGSPWLDRARILAERAAREIGRSTEARDSLYKGETGVALLAAELEEPALAALPFFEEEGWP